MIRLLLDTGDRATPLDVLVQRKSAADSAAFAGSVDGRAVSFDVHRGTAGAGWIVVGSRVYPFSTAVGDGGVQVWAAGRTHRFSVQSRTPQRAGARAVAAQCSALTAPMPGTVLKVAAAAGTEFAAHEPLVILESMKMELSLSLPHTGRVREVLVRPGELVALGATLLTIVEAE